jgi:plastocyanin
MTNVKSARRIGLMLAMNIALIAVVQSAHAKEETVVMKSLSYDPKVIQIKLNDKIHWENKAYTPHSATSDVAGQFDTGLVQPGKTSKVVEFSKAGTFTYHCSIHGKTMSGQLVVTP